MMLVFDDDRDDPLYAEAKAAVIEKQRVSIATVQRILKIGYNRAARLVEAMEKDGVVSAYDNTGNRRVLVKP